MSRTVGFRTLLSHKGFLEALKSEPDVFVWHSFDISTSVNERLCSDLNQTSLCLRQSGVYHSFLVFWDHFVRLVNDFGNIVHFKPVQGALTASQSKSNQNCYFLFLDVFNACKRLSFQNLFINLPYVAYCVKLISIDFTSVKNFTLIPLDECFLGFNSVQSNLY